MPSFGTANALGYRFSAYGAGLYAHEIIITLWEENTPIYLLQSAILRCLICLNSPVLFVTRVTPRLKAYAPISMSMEPTGLDEPYFCYVQLFVQHIWRF